LQLFLSLRSHLYQISQFDAAYESLTTTVAREPLKHILNTTGIIRFPEAQYDMVRLGLGLYGIDESQTITNELTKAHTLTARVLQIKALSSDETTGYNRAGSSDTATDIAISLKFFLKKGPVLDIKPSKSVIVIFAGYFRAI